MAFPEQERVRFNLQNLIELTDLAYHPLINQFEKPTKLQTFSPLEDDWLKRERFVYEKQIGPTYWFSYQVDKIMLVKPNQPPLTSASRQFEFGLQPDLTAADKIKFIELDPITGARCVIDISLAQAAALEPDIASVFKNLTLQLLFHLIKQGRHLDLFNPLTYSLRNFINTTFPDESERKLWLAQFHEQPPGPDDQEMTA